MDFDIANLFSTEINNIKAVSNQTILNTLLQWLFAFQYLP